MLPLWVPKLLSYTLTSPVFYVTVITLRDFPGVEADVAPAAQNPGRYRVWSACEGKDRESAQVWSDIYQLGVKDRQPAIKGLLHFVKLAQVGKPLTALMDKKRLHDLRTFFSAHTQANETVWRYRHGDIRVLFYYADGKAVLLTGMLAKRKDSYSAAELNAAEHAIDAYLAARKASRVKLI